LAGNRQVDLDYPKEEFDLVITRSSIRAGQFHLFQKMANFFYAWVRITGFRNGYAGKIGTRWKVSPTRPRKL